MPGARPGRGALTAVFELPVTGFWRAGRLLPYEVVVPYSKVTAVLTLFALTVPFRVALVAATDVIAPVVTVGSVVARPQVMETSSRRKFVGVVPVPVTIP